MHHCMTCASSFMSSSLSGCRCAGTSAFTPAVENTVNSSLRVPPNCSISSCSLFSACNCCLSPLDFTRLSLNSSPDFSSFSSSASWLA
ncbi:hypothetical protein PF002_g28409 [Phytophthora fragariae]|uniref:Uncharacterized protein n=2 Tax=Phytophthora fragariae TaxID=53985 RepID=A0A6A3W2W9_9STRA|nr:hypothetical protein PF003_g40247 [Phytophthora fragariae]KAE8971893.1 hypothetical protein PF011_g25862 [Phytophthora fragariae]KAE9177167.1 hypothetical protein PF002_g28409 [Phytophthora fragariae]